MGGRFLLTLAVALVSGTVASCGGETASGASSSSTPSPSPTLDVSTVYRHVLEHGNELLNIAWNDPTACGFGLPPYKDSCRQWVLMNEALVGQFIGLLSHAQVPAANASGDQLLRQGLRVLVADDAAAANALASGSEPAATRALGKLQADTCTGVSPVMSGLDPSIPTREDC